MEPAFSIRLTDRNSASEKEQAQNIIGYFDFCFKRNMINKGEIKIKSGSDTVTGAEIVLDFAAEKEGIFKEGNLLYVRAKDAYNGEELVRKLSFAMDKRFEYFFGIENADGIPGNLPDHLSVRGKYVPVRMKRCFESKGAK
jgi:hypothetical protein